MESRNIYKCFISSPADCQKEREACQRVTEIVNNGIAKHLGIIFEPFMWEYDVLPDMGRNAQEIIDEYVKKSNYDIFIGIMKNRFGKPTKKAGSGTEHEFNDALERKIKYTSQKPSPQILFFFGKEKVDLDNPEIENILSQHKKVKEFKSKIEDQGLYIDFTDTADFETELKRKLELFAKENSPFDKSEEKIKEADIVFNRLQEDLDESLRTYNEKSPVWIEPIVSSKKEIPDNPTKNNEHRIELRDFIENPNDIIIKAPSEFGLTSLAHYLKLEAWKIGKTFVYIDAKKTKKHKVVKDIINECRNYFFKPADSLDCILLDSVYFEENGMMQMTKIICEEFKNIPLVIFNTLDNNFFIQSSEDEKVEIKRNFTSYYLLPLPQNDVRKLVTSYSNLRSLEDDNDLILNKVTKDLETLNMHRTAKNCISILRACSKIGIEYNPVNRTKLLEAILNTIFEEYDIPTYRDKKPDVKDCSFVLGYFCEVLLLKNDFEFTDEFFKIKIREFCEANYIQLDLSYLLNVLIDNSIFIKKNSGFYYFKNSYWVFYFIAQRMNMNKDFLENIFENKRYIDFPEIIEFYTGIDRNKEDALHVLNKNIDETLLVVRDKVNIPNTINPYKSISWHPSIETLEKEEEKIGENVISSGLPDEVKDQYEDKHYNQIRPYYQVINSVFRDYSFLVLLREISATSRALRNSDFVEPSLKIELLDKITQGWNEINKLLIVLAPLLADKGKIDFEGATFKLSEDDFKIDDPKEKRLAVLLAVPTNIAKLFKDDLFSIKMGPLLIAKAENESNSLVKHELMLIIIAERPKDWNKTIDKYIVSLDKNSFFLCDVLDVLQYNIDFNATEPSDRRILMMLASKCRAKHIFKKNNPDLGLIQRLNKMEGGSEFLINSIFRNRICFKPVGFPFNPPQDSRRLVS